MYSTSSLNKNLGTTINPINLSITQTIKTLGINICDGFTPETRTSSYTFIYGDLQVMLYGDGSEIIYGY